MNISVIYKDEKRIVKMVTGSSGTLFYTRTYLLDDEGYVDKMITVFSDGTVEEQ